MESLFDPRRREMAQEYRRKTKRYGWVERILSLVLLVGFFSFGLEVRLFHLLTDWTGSMFLKLLVYLGGLIFLSWVIGIIPDYFFSYKLERRYQLSNQTVGAWLSDQIKYLLLGLVFLFGASEFFILLVERYPSNWWLTYSIGGFFFYLLLSFLLPVVFLPLFFRLTPYPDTPLRQRLEGLFQRAKVKVAEIYEFNLSSKTNSANAAVIGMGKTRKIILGDNLRDRYTDAEIEAVMAHEIGHHVHKDIFTMVWISLCGILFTTFCTSIVWPFIVKWRGYESLGSIESLPMLGVVIGVFYSVFNPLQLYLSRRMEVRCDKFALGLIGNPRDLATAFAKLADDGLSLLRFDWYTLIFKASHPPIGMRIEMALGWKKKTHKL